MEHLHHHQIAEEPKDGGVEHELGVLHHLLIDNPLGSLNQQHYSHFDNCIYGYQVALYSFELQF